MVEQGDIDDAIAVLRDHADTGDTFAAGRLADLLLEQGDIKGLRERADAGDKYASGRLADVLVEQGDIDELRIEVLCGNALAAEELVTAVNAQSVDAGKRLLQYGLNADGTMPWDTLEASPG